MEPKRVSTLTTIAAVTGADALWLDISNYKPAISGDGSKKRCPTVRLRDEASEGQCEAYRPRTGTVPTKKQKSSP